MKINLPDNVEQLKESKWLSITVQTSLLGLNFLLISQKIINSFILISVCIVFSLFILQSVHHRFIYFNPINQHVQVPTPHFDTFFLYIFTFLAGGFLFLGISSHYEVDPLPCYDEYLKDYILWIFGVMAIALPLFFYIAGRGLITYLITKKIKSKTLTYQTACNDCGKAGALYEHVILHWNDLRVRKTCKHCNDGKTIEYKTNARIG
jgi:hypothetical protein